MSTEKRRIVQKRIVLVANILKQNNRAKEIDLRDRSHLHLMGPSVS